MVFHFGAYFFFYPLTVLYIFSLNSILYYESLVHDEFCTLYIHNTHFYFLYNMDYMIIDQLYLPHSTSVMYISDVVFLFLQTYETYMYCMRLLGLWLCVYQHDLVQGGGGRGNTGKSGEGTICPATHEEDMIMKLIGAFVDGIIHYRVYDLYHMSFVIINLIGH